MSMTAPVTFRAKCLSIRQAAVLSAAMMLLFTQPSNARVAGASGSKPDYFAMTKSIELFGDVYREVAENYVDDVDVSEFMLAGIDGMLERLDPYTTFLDESRSQELDEITTGQYAGVGITIGVYAGDIYIMSCIAGYPAANAGLMTGDRIMTINGEPARNRTIDEIKAKIKGAAGSTVRIGIERSGEQVPREFSLTREAVRVNSVAYAGLFGNVGYVALSGFGERSAEELLTALESLRKSASQGNRSMQGIMVDLRGNPGGLLGSAVEVASLFVDKGSRIVSTKGRVSGSVQEYVTKNVPIFPDIPLAVLIDGDSASAAEIVAGAVQELDRGVIVGESSFGKGLVQSVIALPYDHVLKITTSKYYTPSGRLIQKSIERDGTHRKVVAGSAASDSTKVFYTKNRRKVYGGGGIMPDIAVASRQASEYEQALDKGGYFFRFASRYRSRNASLSEESLQKEPLLKEFNGFIAGEGFSFRSRPMQSLDSLKAVMKKDGVAGGSAGMLDSLEKSLAAWNATRIEQDFPRIVFAVRNEILRHYDEQAFRRAELEDDPVFVRALALLGNPKHYREYLRKRP